MHRLHGIFRSCQSVLIAALHDKRSDSTSALRSGAGGFRTWVQPGFELFFSFIRVQTWVQLGFELLEEFELFQGSENSILNLGLIWVLTGFHSIWVEPGLNLG